MSNGEDKKQVACQLFHPILALLMVVFSGVAQAESYRLQEKDCPVCQAFNAKVGVEGCNYISVDATTAPFRTPVWEPRDLMASKDLIKKIENFISRGDQAAPTKLDDPKSLEAWIRQKIEFDLGKLWGTEVDIDNDGAPDKVVKYETGRCLMTTFWGTALVVLDAAGTSIDVVKSKPIVQHGYQGTVHEILSYKDESFVLLWYPETEEVKLIRFKNGRKQLMK
jgi:hypothetical protein